MAGKVKIESALVETSKRADPDTQPDPREGIEPEKSLGEEGPLIAA